MRILLCPFFILVFCLSNAVVGDGVTDTVTIVHISDTHICELADYHPVIAEDRQHYGSSFGPLKKFFNTVPKKLEADIVVLTGDIIDCYEAETTDGKMVAGQVEKFIELYNLCPVPLYMVLGNHDIFTYSIEQDLIKESQHNSQQARAAWIRNISCFKNGTYYARTYKVGATKYRLIFLDDGFYLKDSQMGNLWDVQQLDWLNYQLGQSKDEKVILFMHICIPVGDTNKDGVCFSKPQGWPFKDTYEKGIMKILNTSPSIIAAFVGHNHRNIIEDIPFPAGHKITQIETAAFGLDPNNWRIVELKEDNITVYRQGQMDIEKKISFETKQLPAKN